MEASITTKAYKNKIPSEYVKFLRFERMELNIDQLIQLITHGHGYAGVFSLDEFGMKDKTYDNFRLSWLITLDIDDSDTPMHAFIEVLRYKPTFAYTSCSNGIKGFRFRLVYVLSSPVTSVDEYRSLTLGVVRANNITLFDKASLSCHMYYNGNGCDNVEVYRADKTYDKTLFCPWLTEKDSTESAINSYILKKENNMRVNCTFDYPEFEQDCNDMNMSNADILDKYRHMMANVESTPLPEVDDDTPYIMIPEDYAEIRRLYDNGGRPIRLVDGNKRRRKLFANGMLRRYIKPDITLDNLTYNLIYELEYFISNENAKNIIDRSVVMQIAKDVMNADPKRYEEMKGSDRKFIVNPAY